MKVVRREPRIDAFRMRDDLVQPVVKVYPARPAAEAPMSHRRDRTVGQAELQKIRECLRRKHERRQVLFAKGKAGGLVERPKGPRESC